MPEHEPKPHLVNNGKSVQPANPHQSAWLTHWTGTRSDASPSTHDHLTQLSRSRGDDYDLNDHDSKKPRILSGVEMASDNFGSSEGVKDVDLATSLKKPSSQSFPFFRLGQENGGCSTTDGEREARGVLALGPQVSHKLTTSLTAETSSRESRFQPEGSSQIPTERVKYHMFFGESSFSCSRPCKEKFGPASHMEQGVYKLDSRTAHEPENFRQLTTVFESNEHEKPEMPSFLRRNNTAHLKIDPSSSNPSHALIEEQYQRMQKHIRMGLLPHQIGSPETTKSRAMHHGSCSFQNLPHFVHDVETTRICAPLNSIHGLAGGLHSFSRTTHSLLITKQTDVNLYQEDQIVRESRVSAQFKGKAPRELQYNPTHFAHAQRGVKLQLLGSSSDHESQENVEDVQKNESSADTDAMDMEQFNEPNHLSDIHSSPSNKDIMWESTLPPRPRVAMSAEEDRHRKHKVELPDINLDLSALPAASSSTDKAEPCPSRTQSLDMNTLHFNVDHTSNSKSDDGSESNHGPEPGNRWINRLKLSTSNSHALGTKSSRLAESSSHGKLKKFFTIIEGKTEPASDKCHHKGSETETGKCSVKEQERLMGESSSVQTRQECKDITLSHSWIQRWSHQNPETLESCKPENGNLALEELQKKQFPSIAAMALMGKTMSSFRRCEFQKKDSFVVWNSKGF